MKNPTRRYTAAEYELLDAALRSHAYFLVNVQPALSEVLKRGLGLEAEDALEAIRERQLRGTERLRQRLLDLFWHDIPFDMTSVPDDERTLCLGCKHRHAPHCGHCPGCLPEELPE